MLHTLNDSSSGTGTLLVCEYTAHSSNRRLIRQIDGLCVEQTADWCVSDTGRRLQVGKYLDRRERERLAPAEVEVLQMERDRRHLVQRLVRYLPPNRPGQVTPCVSMGF